MSRGTGPGSSDDGSSFVGWSHADCNNIDDDDDDDYGQPGWDNVLINSVTVGLDIVV